MQAANRKLKKEMAKCGRRLLTAALNGFYVFEDDEIEDKIDKADLRFAKSGRTAVRSHIWSHEKIRAKICAQGYYMFGPSPSSVNDTV